MTAIMPTTRLHLNKREITFLVPLYITGTVALISVLISLLFLRSGGVPGSADWIAGSQLNPGMAYALPGFLVYLGVQSVATTFPFALTLGSTRRSFVGGTLLWAVIASAYLTAIMTVLTLIELATDHWFSNFYIFDIAVLGAGDLTRLIPIVFLSTLSMLTIGGVFGASWIRFGGRGPQFIGVGLAIVIIVALIVILPAAPTIIAAFQVWWLAVLAAVVILLSSIGMWLILRTAIVR
ncbi:hypothetical protein BKA04_002075 [Cryobacterium mesophilum]|uniref:Uncharacterized protein n=1 Tax=Terrimesophilobacter mesophilus TaxID=433647 RepID=A0A4R8VC11_9MICO|nr:hypothetical protein [Terrimesophilobacter mesophilus]MBB5633852.1 hypothetical protein [Terrimesophilobacter mesophilus]TFB80529.1 hypothetical protein E3N84_11080 [Terrimesophilobacter mesophilus]